ncbi:MAG: hypothetical protein CMH52_08545 [Myxococcales bacterium]|mgnify:CR=1 FL=1|nr:hypothetical protein [Myxococcales bacterium]
MERHLILNGNHPCFAEAGDNDGGGEQSIATDLSGQDLGGRFRLDELRIDTAAGQTYSGIDTAGDAPVWVFVAADAFKSDDPEFAALEDTTAKSFEIDHSNVLALRHIDQTDDGRTYIVSEKQEGLSLAEKLTADGPVMPRVAGRITQELLQALNAVHATGMIHQGIRPDTIFLVQDDVGVERAVLGGLGQHHTLALALASQREKSACRAQPEYLSPEAVAGKDLTQQTDLYSLGLVLYEMLTGRTAFGGGDFRKTARQHAITRPLSPRIVRRQAQIPRSLDAVVMKLLEKTPTRRFASTEEVAGALDAVANEDDSSRNRTSLNFKPVASRKPEPVSASSTDSTDAADDAEISKAPADEAPNMDAAPDGEQTKHSKDEADHSDASTESKPDQSRERPRTEPLVSISSKIAVSKAPEPSEPPVSDSDLGNLERESTKFKETGRWFVESVDELQATNPNLAAQFDEYTIPKDRNIFPIIILVLGLIVGGLVWSSYDSDDGTASPDDSTEIATAADKKEQDRRAEIAARAAASAEVDARAKPPAQDVGPVTRDAQVPQSDAAKSPLTAEEIKRNEQVDALRKQALTAIEKKNWQGNSDALLESILELKKVDPENGFDGPLAEKVKDAVLLSVTELTTASDFAGAKRNARLAKTLMPGLQIAHTMLKRVETLEAAAEKKKAADDKKRLADEKNKADERRRNEADEKKRLAAEKRKEKNAEKKKQDAEKKRIAAETKKQDAEKKRIAAEKKKQDAEKKRIAAEKKKRDTDKKRLAAEKKKAQDTERKRLADEKKRLAAEKKKQDAEKKKVVATSDPYRDAQNHLSKGRWGQAKAAFNKSIQSNPNRAGAYAGLGRVAFQQGQNKMAAKHYAKAVRLSSGNVNYRIKLGLAYFKLGRYDRAKKHWNKALSLSPGNKKATRYLKLLEKKAPK